ncbi:MAG: GNAT family N-acetyltransferase [Sterolibacterium sp.]|jgi:putative hemolysin|nr:GNAT family N-acetyltransferase [Sterolibacterium sp.]
MLERLQNGNTPKTRAFYVGLARSTAEIRAAQRLRYRVFADELGARLTPREPGIDHDYYDNFCEHLVVHDEESGCVIGTYRLLPPEAMRRAGSYYSETEFNLDRLRHLRERTVEVGRACIDAEYRSGGIIALLWAGIIRYMLQNRHEYLIGCASIGMADGGRTAAGIFQHMEAHMAPLEYRVFPNCPLPLERIEPRLDAEVPALIKGYLRAGAWICGQPAWDPDFNTADLLMLLPISRISPRYARHFIERQGS